MDWEHWFEKNEESLTESYNEDYGIPENDDEKEAFEAYCDEAFELYLNDEHEGPEHDKGD